MIEYINHLYSEIYWKIKCYLCSPKTAGKCGFIGVCYMESETK